MKNNTPSTLSRLAAAVFATAAVSSTLPAFAAVRHMASSQQTALTAESVRRRAGSVDLMKYLANYGIDDATITSHIHSIVGRFEERHTPDSKEENHWEHMKEGAGFNCTRVKIVRNLDGKTISSIQIFKQTGDRTFLSVEAYPSGGAGSMLANIELRVLDEKYKNPPRHFIEDTNRMSVHEYFRYLETNSTNVANVFLDMVEEPEGVSPPQGLRARKRATLGSVSFYEPMAKINPELRKFFGTVSNPLPSERNLPEGSPDTLETSVVIREPNPHPALVHSKDPKKAEVIARRLANGLIMYLVPSY